MENVYYLETIASKSVNNGTGTEKNVWPLSVEYMKSEDFLNDLNNNSKWEKWKAGEDGYPVFE